MHIRCSTPLLYGALALRSMRTSLRRRCVAPQSLFGDAHLNTQRVRGYITRRRTGAGKLWVWPVGMRDRGDG